MPVADSGARSRILSFAKSKNSTVNQKIQEAISAIGNGKKGASFTAIFNWILGNYSIWDPERMKILVKKSILQLLTMRTIRRGSSSLGASGTSGSFVLIVPKSNPVKQRKGAGELSKSMSALDEEGNSSQGIMDTKQQRRKSAVDKANSIRSGKKFAKVRETGIKTDNFSKTEYQKNLEYD